MEQTEVDTLITHLRGWQAFFKRGHLARNSRNGFRYVLDDILLNRYIIARHWLRHYPLSVMWGCLIVIAIPFPLVLGKRL